MIAGGVDSPIAPLILRGFQLMRIMSTRWNAEPERASRPFSRDRDGFVIAEGAWFFVLEEMEQAQGPRRAHLRRNRRLRVHLRSLSSRAPGGVRRRARARHRHGDGGGRHRARRDVQYINYHGTSTELNDRIETRAVKLAFNGHAYKLAGSSLKSLIGHPQGACGAAAWPRRCWPCAMASSRPPSTWTSRIPNAIWTTSRPKRGKLDIEYAVANCIAFGSKNSALVLKRVHVR